MEHRPFIATGLTLLIVLGLTAWGTLVRNIALPIAAAGVLLTLIVALNLWGVICALRANISFSYRIGYLLGISTFLIGLGLMYANQVWLSSPSARQLADMIGVLLSFFGLCASLVFAMAMRKS